MNNLFLVKNGYSKMPKIYNKLYINKKQKKGKIIYIYFWNKNKNTIEI